VFFSKDMRFAHVGDVLFNGSVGRTDLNGGDHAALIRSIKTKLLRPGSNFGHERQTNPFLNGMM